MKPSITRKTSFRKDAVLLQRGWVVLVWILFFDCGNIYSSSSWQAYSLLQPSLVVPKHVAFVCDGNSRWAKARNMPESAGHLAGANRMLELIRELQHHDGIQYCTLFALSTENWKRPTHEIASLLTLMEDFSIRYYPQAIKDNVQVNVLGNLEDGRIPETLRMALTRLQRDTAAAAAVSENNINKLTVCLAINYGSKSDIVNASIRLAKAIADGHIDPLTVTDADFSAMLWTHDIPDPDLIIRTGGEQRLSNFLLYEAAYAELFFTDTLWPDFDASHMEQALQWYANRSRRFGGKL